MLRLFPPKMLKGLKIVSLNVHSLYSSLNELTARFKDFDIICCCETWLNNTFSDQIIKIEGFEIFRLDRENGNILNKGQKLKRGGGLIIYIKKTLSDFTQIISTESQISANIEQLKTFERNFNLDQIIKSPTRIFKNTKSLLNLIFTNMDHIVSLGVLNLALSDHLPVFLIKKKQKFKPPLTYTKGRSYNSYNKDKFQSDIKNHPNWVSFWNLEENNPDMMWDIMLEIVRETSDLHAPFRNMKFREDTPQWITRDLISEINHKDFLFNKAKKFPSEENWETFRQKKNEVRKLLAAAKEEFVKEKLEEHETNPRKFWRTINDISGIGKNKNSRKCTKIVDDNGKLCENLEAADFLN